MGATVHAGTETVPRGSPSRVGELIDRLARSPGGVLTHIAVVVPPGAPSSLPAYDLAMAMSDELSSRDRRDAADLIVVTPEHPSDATLERLASARIHVVGGRVAHDWAWGRLLLDDGTSVSADRVIEMPSRTC